MIEERARVLGVAPGYAWVEIVRGSACSACPASFGCGASAVTKSFGKRGSPVQVSDRIGAAVGDQVAIGIPEGTLARASMLAYLLPLIVLILATTAAHAAGIREAPSAMAGILGLLVGLWIVRRLTRGAAGRERYRPVLLRRIS